MSFFKLRYYEDMKNTYSQRRSLFIGGTTLSPCLELAEPYHIRVWKAHLIDELFERGDCHQTTNQPPFHGLDRCDLGHRPTRDRIRLCASIPL